MGANMMSVVDPGTPGEWGVFLLYALGAGLLLAGVWLWGLSKT